MHRHLDAHGGHRRGALHHRVLPGAVRPLPPRQHHREHGEEPRRRAVVGAEDNHHTALRARVRGGQIPARELRLLRQHRRQRVRELGVVSRALLGEYHHDERLVLRVPPQRGGGRDHRQRPPRRDVLDPAQVLREDAMRALGRGEWLAVKQLQRHTGALAGAPDARLGVVGAHAERPDGLQQRVHLVDPRDQRVCGVLGEHHLPAVTGVGDGGDEVHALAAKDGVVRVPVRALAPRAGRRGVHAHAHARPPEDHVVRFFVHDGGELRDAKHLPRPVVVHQLVLRPQAELRRGHRRRERDFERVALRVDLVPREALDALAHDPVVRLLHQKHRARRFRRGGRAALDVREHQHLSMRVLKVFRNERRTGDGASAF